MTPVHIYLFMDALGWEIVQRHHFLEDILPFRYRVKMQFGYSSTAIPTILSGEYPRVHNHFSFFYYDPQNSPFKNFRFIKYAFGAGLHPRCLLNRGRVRHQISKLVAWWKGYTGYFQLYEMPYDKLPYFDYCEKTDIFARNGLSPVKNLHDILAESGLKYHISDWRKTEMQNLDSAETDLINRKCDFAFIYTAGFDGFLHDHVADETAIAERLKLYETRLRTLLDHLRSANIDFHFTIISDHGMTPLAGTADIRGAIEKLNMKFGRDYAAVYDSTMARFWYLTDQARQQIQGYLRQFEASGRFVTRAEKVQYGIDFPNNKFGEDIFLMNPGIQIAPCDLGHKPMNGMHGFSPEDKDSFAVFLSTQEPSSPPLEVRDYFQLMKGNIDNPSNSLKNT